MEFRLVSPLDKVHYGDEAPQCFCRPLSVLKGETASFQVAWKLDAGERPRYITLRAPLARVRRVIHVPVVLAAYPDADGDTRTAPGLYPDLLRDWDGPLRAFCDHWESAWLDVCFEEAGDFEVLVEALDDAGNRIAARVQKVHVVNAALPRQTLIHTKWLHLDGICRIYHLTPFTEAFYAVLEKWVRLAVSRGINMILTPIHTPPLDTYVGGERMTAQLVDVWEENGQYRFGTEKLEDWFRRLRAWGVEYFEMAHLFSQWGAKCAPKIVSADGRRLFGWDDASTGERYAAARSVSACVDESGALIPYQEVGNTAYITFDSFDMDLGRDYYDPEVQRTLSGMIAADNIALIHYANERINREDSPIENVVIDLSHNSGGMADAAIFVISWALGPCRFSTVNPKSEAQYTVGYQADVNLDGRITAADALDLSRFKVYCLISEFSFSCGNLVPAAFKESGLVTLLGRKSGGGACVVQPAVAADGTVYQYSSRYRLSTVKNGSYYSIDQGVEPDFVISDPAHFYDRAWLTDYICQLP